VAAGPVIDPAGFVGQIEGGGVQALGFALSEDVPMLHGNALTRNFDAYMMPSIADAPESMRVFAIEALDRGDPYGPRGVGELGIGAAAPAIGAAVADAVGAWMATTPFDPDKLLSEIEGKACEGRG